MVLLPLVGAPIHLLHACIQGANDTLLSVTEQACGLGQALQGAEPQRWGAVRQRKALGKGDRGSEPSEGARPLGVDNGVKLCQGQGQGLEAF